MIISYLYYFWKENLQMAWELGVLVAYHRVDARENDDGFEAAQISVGEECSEQSENIGSSNPVSDMGSSTRDCLVHFPHQVTHHIHCNCKES